MPEPIRPISNEDILLWPDGFWCLRYEHSDHSGARSDDYEVIPFGTPRWESVNET